MQMGKEQQVSPMRGGAAQRGEGSKAGKRERGVVD
jgi:hypothetical protein